MGFHKVWSLGLLFSLFYINNSPKIAAKDTKIVLYADDTRIIVTNPNSLMGAITLCYTNIGNLLPSKDTTILVTRIENKLHSKI
jgi:hypothetical protein